MPSYEGLILDATALIDFCWLGEWEWLQKQYSPLFIAQEVLDSDRLDEIARQAASQHLQALVLDTEEMFSSFIEFRLRSRLLSEADRSTLALARHRSLLCVSDDSLIVTVCQEYGIEYMRMLRLLNQMVKTGYKEIEEVIDLADILIKERGKWIAPAILAQWKRSLTD